MTLLGISSKDWGFRSGQNSWERHVLNLVLNAIEAMSDTKGENLKLTIRTSMADDGAIEVAVSDAGSGISKEMMDRVFEPFFTTMRDGMGMGLSISRTIVEAHGGRLWLSQNSGRGCTLSFTLPTDQQNQGNGL